MTAIEVFETNSQLELAKKLYKFKVEPTREFLVFESTSHWNKGEATPFREEWGDKKVQYLRVHGSAGYAVSGFQLVDKDHRKSEILGKPGKETHHPFQTAVVLNRIKFISVDHNSKYCYNISFQRGCTEDIQEVYLGNYD